MLFLTFSYFCMQCMHFYYSSMKKHLHLFILLLFLNGLNAQIINTFDNTKAHYIPTPSKVTDDFYKSNSVGATITWVNNFQINTDGSYSFSFKAPVAFTSFGAGWLSDNLNIPAADFEIYYRARIKGNEWGQWFEDHGYVSPEETPTNLYWTDLLFLDNEEQHHEVELLFIPPSGVNILELRIALIDITGTAGSTPPKPVDINDTKGSQNCPSFPSIILRSQWCGSYTDCHNTTYYQNITPTHTVVHHGGSPNTYTDAAAVIRSYWNHHVNTLGWEDIGYNYLFCKYGDFYQGRHNPNLPITDVRGVHAGIANGGTIGLNFLGDSDVTLPTTVQLDKIKHFLAWWFDHKGFDPTSSAGMTTQAYGWQVQPRICGHRDISPTSCPGNALYNELPTIRTGTKSIIDSCTTTPPNQPTNLQVNVGPCPDMDITFTWVNSDTAWYILLADDAAYTTPYIRWVSGLTTYTGPASFVLQSDGTTPLVLDEGQTYYWKMYAGGNFTNGPAFTTPVCDSIPPTTQITCPGPWVTENFTAHFNDTDNPNGSGIARRFYQVSDFDGSYWRGNFQRGFFKDTFENLDTTLWKVPQNAGAWYIDSNALVQTDTLLNNTNIYAPLTQTLSNTYLYHFTAKVEDPTHTNGRRFGLHYFSDNGALSNRGNSYFVWFRIDSNKLEFYKVVNNVYSLENVIDDIVITPETVYDFKIIYDRITGETYVYIDDSLRGAWVDQQPLTNNGDYISLRTGNSMLTVYDFNVYRTRHTTANITVGELPSKDIRYQNPSPAVHAAKIKSIATDNAHNISPIAVCTLNVDWSPPDTISYVNDGLGANIDTTTSFIALSANWAPSSDTNSDIDAYWYAIGSSPGDTNIVGWTNNGLNISITHSGLNLDFDTTYYFSVKALNGAGLWSSKAISSGALVFNATDLLTANFSMHTNTICEGDSIYFINHSIGANQYEWFFQGGTPEISGMASPAIVYDSAGIFDVELRVFDNFNNSDTLHLNQYITVFPAPKASFYAIDTAVYLPSAIAFFSNTSSNADAFLWSFGDAHISFDANPWYLYTTEGQYAVKLIAMSEFCKNDTTLKNNYIHVLSPSAINETSLADNIFLLENPIRENIELKISLTNASTVKIKMTDILGRTDVLMAGQYLSEGTHSLHIPFPLQKASGVYFLNIFINNKQKTLKFLKL